MHDQDSPKPLILLLCCCLLVTPLFGRTKETQVDIKGNFTIHSNTVEHGEHIGKEESRDRHSVSPQFPDPNQCKLYGDGSNNPISVYSLEFYVYSDEGKDRYGFCCDGQYAKNCGVHFDEELCDPQFKICVKRHTSKRQNCTYYGPSKHRVCNFAFPGSGPCIYGESPWSENYSAYQNQRGDLKFGDHGNTIGPNLPNPYTICTPFLSPFAIHIAVKDDDDITADDPIADFEGRVSQSDVESLGKMWGQDRFNGTDASLTLPLFYQAEPNWTHKWYGRIAPIMARMVVKIKMLSPPSVLVGR